MRNRLPYNNQPNRMNKENVDPNKTMIANVDILIGVIKQLVDVI